MPKQPDSEMSFEIQRIYVKDISFESPCTPAIFQKEWKPQMKLDLDTCSNVLAEDIYEVVLRVTLTATLEDKPTFICEVQQAGIFFIKSIESLQLQHCLAAYCPNILFPYARECANNLISKGTFPHFHMDPINFDVLFMNYVQKESEKLNHSGDIILKKSEQD